MGTGESRLSPSLLLDGCLSLCGTAHRAHYLTAFKLVNTTNLCYGSYKAPVLKTAKPGLANLEIDSTTIKKSMPVNNTR